MMELVSFHELFFPTNLSSRLVCEFKLTNICSICCITRLKNIQSIPASECVNIVLPKILYVKKTKCYSRLPL